MGFSIKPAFLCFFEDSLEQKRIWEIVWQGFIHFFPDKEDRNSVQLLGGQLHNVLYTGVFG